MRRGRTPNSVPRLARLQLANGSVRIWRSPFTPGLHALVLTPTERRFVRLTDFFDVAEVFDGTQWLVGGVLDQKFDDIELVTDAGGSHRPLRCRGGWLALMPSGWTGAADLVYLRDGEVVESHRIEEVERFIDRGWTAYAPIDTD